MPGQDVLVIGLGYVGLPLAIQAARSGFRVTGLDLNAEIVAGLMAGGSHVDDVTDAHGPPLPAGRAATATAGHLLKLGTLVSLESTSYPGTTEEVLGPLLEK